MSVSNTEDPAAGSGGIVHWREVDAADGETRQPDRFPLPRQATGKRKRYAPKETICHEGDGADRSCFIRKGLVKLVSYLPNGRARIIRLHSAGQWLGLEGLLGVPFRHTAIAVGEVEVEHCPVQQLRDLRQQDPGAFCNLLCQWHGDLAQADRWIAEFSTGEIRPRVARLLEYLAQLEYGESADRVELLTVHEMADILGVTAESVSRILAGFKRSDILHRQLDPYKDIFHLDSQRLHQETLR